MNSEQEIEQELQAKGLNAPRLTPAMIDAVIVSETFTMLPSERTMVCEMTLKNGFTVRGESTCISLANFDREIGEKLSRQRARETVWALEAYLLTQRIFEAQENQ